MKLYFLVGRLLWPFALVGLYLFSVLTRTSRVRVVVQSERQEFLLLKTWLGSGKWELPGGGVGRGETLEAAAVRELREETGMDVSAEALQPLFTLKHRAHKEVVFGVTVPSSSLPDSTPSRFEVEEMAWFSANNLPPLGSLAERVLAQVAQKR